MTTVGLLTKLPRWAAGIIARMTTDRVVHVGKASTTILDPEIVDQPGKTAGYVPPIKPAGPAGNLELIPGFDVAMFKG